MVMSASNLTLDARSPEQAKADRDLKDRQGWYAGRYPDGGYVIWARDGRIVCICAKEADRDFIMESVRKAVAP